VFGHNFPKSVSTNKKISMRLPLFSLATAVLVLLLLSFYAHFLVMRPSREVYPRQGIDVSRHQGAIDWDMVATAGVDFAYIKATEGGDYTDRMFSQNWQQSAGAGIRHGAYHFFTLCRSGREQAAHVIATIPKEATALPLAVDLEFGGNCAARPTHAVLHKELADFLTLTEQYYQRPVILYLVKDFDDYYAISKSFPRALWYRSLYRAPGKLPQPLAIWQYHNWTRVSGIEGPVDWNAATDQLAHQ
jgi:lysozyme